MTIDYYCREDLTVTTLKEFFEIFISSLKKEQAFHQELTSALYSSVGISMKFDQQNTQATLTIFLGGLAWSSTDHFRNYKRSLSENTQHRACKR